MAGYPRKLLSLELALKNIIKELKKDEIKEITGKSESHFRKCTDEQDLDHNIHHFDSVKLDLEFRRRKLGSPMLEAHESLLEAADLKLGKLDNTSNTLIIINFLCRKKVLLLLRIVFARFAFIITGERINVWIDYAAGATKTSARRK